jgi:hypothetical protein
MPAAPQLEGSCPCSRLPDTSSSRRRPMAAQVSGKLPLMLLFWRWLQSRGEGQGRNRAMRGTKVSPRGGQCAALLPCMQCDAAAMQGLEGELRGHSTAQHSTAQHSTAQRPKRSGPKRQQLPPPRSQLAQLRQAELAGPVLGQAAAQLILLEVPERQGGVGRAGTQMAWKSKWKYSHTALLRPYSRQQRRTVHSQASGLMHWAAPCPRPSIREPQEVDCDSQQHPANQHPANQPPTPSRHPHSKQPLASNHQPAVLQYHSRSTHKVSSLGKRPGAAHCSGRPPLNLQPARDRVWRLVKPPSAPQPGGKVPLAPLAVSASTSRFGKEGPWPQLRGKVPLKALSFSALQQGGRAGRQGGGEERWW